MLTRLAAGNLPTLVLGIGLKNQNRLIGNSEQSIIDYNRFFSGMRNTKTWCKSISTPFVQHHHVVHPCCELRTLCIYATKKNRISAYHYHMSRTVTAKQLLKIILNKMLLWELNNT